MLDYRLRPLRDTSWTGQVDTRRPTFRMDWPAMLDNLAAEVDRLDGHDVTIEVHAPADSLTNRGSIKRGGIVWSPAVAVSFDTTEHGEMTLRCDRYTAADYGARSTTGTAWQSNVHAIGLHLEALRSLERHGVARGEQYDAYKALPSGSPAAAAAMSAESAVTLLLDAAGRDGTWPFLPDEQRKVVRAARRAHHPDRGGAPSEWANIDQAVQTLITAGVFPEGT